MRLLFHVQLQGGDPNPYAFVVNAASQTIEECYRIEHGIHHCALDAYEQIKDQVSSIEKIYCDPQDGPVAAEEFLKQLKQSRIRPETLFSSLILHKSQPRSLR